MGGHPASVGRARTAEDEGTPRPGRDPEGWHASRCVAQSKEETHMQQHRREKIAAATASGEELGGSRTPAMLDAHVGGPPGTRPPAATAPRPLLLELRQAYETAQAAELAVGRQQAHVRQRYQALVAQLKSVQGQAHSARDRGTAHQKLMEALGLHDHLAELDAQVQRLQRQRDVKALAVLAAAAAYGACREATHQVLNAWRLSQQAAAELPPALAAMELDRAIQAQTQLAALIGEAEVQALVDERAWRPDWLQER
jgi:hypothetical protein